VTYIEKKLQDRVGFFILEADDALRESRIDEESLLTSGLRLISSIH
jgi:hypothetical protein